MWVFVALITLTAVVAHRSDAPESTRRASRLLLIVAVAQGAIGYIQYFTGVPALLVALHVVGATTAWALTVRLALLARHPSTPATSAARSAASPTADPAVAAP